MTGKTKNYKLTPIDNIHTARKTMNHVLSVAFEEGWIGDYYFKIEEIKNGN